ncbi:MAG: hypothetical protein JEY96_14910 [Bacteroidales bacterium]|nr:hypothetical protein [Bacteroidales bacterium]
MIINFIISGICLFVSIKLFLNYNSGKGGPIGSQKKKIIYSFSLLIFLAFIVFLNRGFYSNDNQNYKQIMTEIKKEYYELENMISVHYDNTNLVIQDKQTQLRVLIQQIDCDSIINKDSIQLIKEFKKEYFELEGVITTRKDSLEQLIRVKQFKIGELMQKIENEVHKEKESYADIIRNILSAFLAFVFAFTFKNRILR